MTRGFTLPVILGGVRIKKWYSGDNWYLTSGITIANVLAAFRPKDAPSLADSYTNIVTPGTNNAAPGVAPTFDASTGWTFNGTSTILYVGSGALKTVVPLSIVCLFYADNSTTDFGLAGISKAVSAGSNHAFFMMAGGATAGDPIQSLVIDNSIFPSASSTTGFSATTWTVGTAVFSANNSRAAYVKGGSKGTNTTSCTPVSPTKTPIGGRPDGSATIQNYFAGKIAAIAYYDVALDDTQTAAISTAMLGIVKWYIAEGSPMPIAVWQPKGAADFATSLVNIANPGTYDASSTGNDPSWAASTGWDDTAATGKYLNSNLVLDEGWSYVFKFANATSGATRTGWGYSGPEGSILMSVGNASNSVSLYNTDTSGASVTQNIFSGAVLAMSPTAAFINGVKVFDITQQSVNFGVKTAFLGCLNSNGSPANYLRGNFHALAVYNTALTDAQLVAISTKAALSV